jgi:hypothetical protein
MLFHLAALAQQVGQFIFIYLINLRLMSLFSNFFQRKYQIVQKLEKINTLNLSMRHEEALVETSGLICELMLNPSLLNEINNIGEFGNFLTTQISNFRRNDELMFISELAFFASTKAMNKNIHPDYLYDRLFIMYNAEDFFIETIKETNNLQYNPMNMSRNNSMHHIKWQAEDILLKMRYHDLFNENKFYRLGSNDSSFNGQEFIEISSMIDDGKFGLINKIDFAKEGGVFINNCYKFLAKKYSFTI